MKTLPSAAQFAQLFSTKIKDDLAAAGFAANDRIGAAQVAQLRTRGFTITADELEGQLKSMDFGTTPQTASVQAYTRASYWAFQVGATTELSPEQAGKMLPAMQSAYALFTR